MFRSSVQYELLDLPTGEGKFEQATLEGKFLISRAGKLTWITLISSQRYYPFTREALTSFCNRFEKLYNQELRDLYTKFDGDISIFHRISFYKVTVDMIADDEFHLRFTLPYKLGSTKGREISLQEKKIYQLAKEIAHKSKGQILLETLLTRAKNSLELDNLEISDLIYDLIQNEILSPIPLEQLKKKFSLQR